MVLMWSYLFLKLHEGVGLGGFYEIRTINQNFTSEKQINFWTPN